MAKPYCANCGANLTGRHETDMWYGLSNYILSCPDCKEEKERYDSHSFDAMPRGQREDVYKLCHKGHDMRGIPAGKNCHCS